MTSVKSDNLIQAINSFAIPLKKTFNFNFLAYIGEDVKLAAIQSMIGIFYILLFFVVI